MHLVSDTTSTWNFLYHLLDQVLETLQLAKEVVLFLF